MTKIRFATHLPAEIIAGNGITVDYAGRDVTIALDDATIDGIIGTVAPLTFPTRAALAAATVPSVVDAVQVLGCITAGDGGSTVYKRVSSAPATADYVTTADGAFFQISTISPRISMYGATGATSDSGTIAAALASIGYSATRELVLDRSLNIGTSHAFGYNPNTATATYNVDVAAAPGVVLTQAGSASLTFIGGFEGARRQVFSGFSAGQLSFARGTDQFPEWYASRSALATDAQPAIQLAVDKANYSTVALGSGTYNLGDTGQNITVSGSNTQIVGRGQVLTDIVLTEATGTSGAFLVQGASASDRLLRAEVGKVKVSRSAGVAGAGGIGLAIYNANGGQYHDMQFDNTLVGVQLYRAGSNILSNIRTYFGSDVPGVVGFDWYGDGAFGGALGAGGNASTILRDCAASREHSGTAIGSIGFKGYGDYVGDMITVNFSTAYHDTGMLIDLATADANCNANADIIHTNPILDGYDTAGYHQKGNVDNLVMSTIIGGWFNSRGVSTTAKGIYAESTKGLHIIGAQHGLGGSNQLSALYVGGGSEILSAHSHYIDQKVGITWDGATDCLSIADRFYSSGRVTSGKHVVMKGNSKRCRVLDPIMGKATLASVAFQIDAGCEDCEIRLGVVDTTNITTLVSNAGTRSRITVSGPATLISDTGTDTYIWSGLTAYTPTLTAAGGALSSASATMSYHRRGKAVVFTATLTITNIGTATGAIIMTLPKASSGNFMVNGRNATTGVNVSGLTTSAATMTIVNGTGAFPAANGQVLVLTGEYNVA